MIKDATFVSEWDGGYATFKTDCKVDMDTGRVFDIEQVDVSGLDLNNLDHECVEIDGYIYDIDTDDDNNYSIVEHCANDVQDYMMHASLDEFEDFCGFKLGDRDSLVSLYDVIPQIPDDVIMEYWCKYYKYYLD